MNGGPVVHAAVPRVLDQIADRASVAIRRENRRIDHLYFTNNGSTNSTKQYYIITFSLAILPIYSVRRFILYIHLYSP